MSSLSSLTKIGSQLMGSMRDKSGMEKQTFDQLSKAVTGFGGSVKSLGENAATKPGAAIGGALDSAGDLAMKGGPIGMAIGGVLKAVGAAFEGVEKLKDYGQKLVSQDVSAFGQQSPAMAAVGSANEMEHNRQKYHQGQYLAESDQRLSESTNKLGRKLATVGDWFSRNWKDFVDAGAKTVDALTPFIDEKGKGDPQPVAASEWMAAAGREYEEKVQRRPKRLGGRA